MAEIEIRAITEDEFHSWKERSLNNYAEEKEKEGLSKADAWAEAESSFQRHLAQGKDSPNHHIYTVTQRNSGAVIGTLWWGIQKQGSKQVAWIYDIILNPDQRGQGLGRKVMEWAQSDVKQKGFDRLGLHVFGHNKIAQKLYLSLGFETTNLVMYKGLP